MEMRDADWLLGEFWKKKDRRPHPEILDEPFPSRPPRGSMRLPVSPHFEPITVPSDRRIGLGTYGWKYDSEIIQEAIEGGVALIDTAEGYGFGRVETALGEVLAQYSPESLPIIASKVATNHMSRSAVINAAKRSRDRLQLPKIPLYQIHWPTYPYGPEPVVEALAELREEGVIKDVGLSNHSLRTFFELSELFKQYQIPIVSLQIRANYEEWNDGTEYLLRWATANGVLVVGYSPLGQGKLRKHPEKALRWAITRGILPIPRTNRVEHLRMMLKIPSDLKGSKGS